MTEINNVKGSGTQVVNLKSTNARDPVEGSNSIERFAAPSTRKTEVPQTEASTNLARGEDPLTKAAEAIEEFIGDSGPETKLRIDKDDDTGRFIYKSVDAESGEVVAQFPPETILEMISKFRDPEGLVVDDKA